MHSVILTPTFLTEAKKLRLTEEELQDIVNTIADDPQGGAIIEGTGGARKMRHATKGKGKSGSNRTIHYYGGDDVPVFLLAIYAKGDKANLTKGEKNALAKILPKIADEYRKAMKKAAAKRK